MVEAFTDLGVGVDHHRRVHALGADGDVVEVLLVEDVEVFLELGDHDGQHVAVLVVAEEGAQFLRTLLLVAPLDDRALVDAHADGEFRVLARLDDLDHLLAVVDVAGVEPDLVHARLDGLEGTLEVEVHVGHDRHRGLLEDLLEGLGVLLLWHRHADDVGPG